MGRPKGSKNKKTIQKHIKKQARKMPLGLLLILLIIVGGVLYYLYQQKLNGDDHNHVSKDGIIYLANENTEAPTLTVTFLELLDNKGKGQIGDSVFIECGDVDILIDAGDKNEGSNTVVPFIEEHVSDDVLELVIVTHADSDHLGGMVGLASGYGALEVPGITYEYIIDFGYVGDTVVYNDYVELRDGLVKGGTKYFSIKDVFDKNNQEALTKYYLGEKTYLDLIDYETYSDDSIKDDNDRSVSCIVTHNEKKFLLCGDAESKEEAALTRLNIGHVDVFKSNHHGSPTSNSEDFLKTITPDYIIIQSSENNSYELPKKVIINRLLKYTDNVYSTFINGNIVFVSDGTNINMTGSRNMIKTAESEWYLTDDPNNPR